MDWEKGEESENVEDRRGMSGRKLAVGGGIGAVIIVLIGALLGVSPDKLKQFLGNAPIGGNERRSSGGCLECLRERVCQPEGSQA